MNNLTEHQKTFLLEKFFKDENYPGWKNIASMLINTGSCIVAGQNPIWCFGVGNFIKTEEYTHGYGCLLYLFDLDYFLSSEYYKSIHEQYIKELEYKRLKLDEEYKELCDFIK